MPCLRTSPWTKRIILTPRRESSRIITQQAFSHSLHPELSFEKWSSRPRLTSFLKYCFPRAAGARKLPSHVRDCGDNGACQLCDSLLHLFQEGCVDGRVPYHFLFVYKERNRLSVFIRQSPRAVT